MRRRDFIYLFLLLMSVWTALTPRPDPQELFSGAFICLFLAGFLSKSYLGLGLPPFGLKRFFYFILYIFFLAKEVVKANFDVAYRVVHPAMPINPGVVVIRTKLKSDIAKLMLANSITLTPGTFTLDIIGDRFLIHWINVKAADEAGATEIIGKKFEKYLKEIFE